MNKSILITGSTGGLGQCLCKVFSSNNFNLIIHGRNKLKLKSLYKKILKNGNQCNIVHGDLSDKNTISKIVNLSIKNNIFGIINNAAIYSNKEIQLLNDTIIREIINVNLISPILIIKKLIPTIKKNKSGFIININSIAGKNASKNETIYCASKFGLRGFTESLQFEVTKHNIRLINISFGGIKTKMTKKRKDWNNLIDASEAALNIFKLIDQNKSLRITDISINRMIY